jgi:hypothetical protein
VSFLTSLLRPTGTEIHDLVVREMDPARTAEFEPVCRGPLVGVLALAVIGIACVVTSPVRIVRRMFQPR